MRRAVITGGVSYHHALMGSPPVPPSAPNGGPAGAGLLAGFEPLDVHRLASVDLADYDLVLVLRSVDNEALWTRRHQVRRFLDQGGVLVAFGEAWTDWFPGCRWEPERPEDLLPPVLAEHPLLAGVAPEELHWHGKGPRWCNHGHFLPPPGAEPLVANRRGDAWLYLDRVTTNGVVLAATNLDLDTHTFHGSATARQLLERLLAWAETEAARTPERRARAARKIAGLFSGVHFQRGFYEDPEFGPHFAIVPVEELAGLRLERYAALWVPRESNQAALVRQRDRIAAYLAGGGTLVTFEELNQPWLAGAAWEQRRVDVQALVLADHPLLAGLGADQVRWHAHGVLVPPPGALTLIGAADGAAVLYLDERSYAPGRVLAGTLDPDCHAGYGSDLPRPLLRAIVRWALTAAGLPASTRSAASGGERPEALTAVSAAEGGKPTR